MLDANIDDEIVHDDLEADDMAPMAPGGARRPRWPWAVGGALAIVLVGVALVVALGSGSSSETEPVDIAAPDLTQRVLESVDADPEAVATELFSTLLPGLTPDDAEALVGELAALLGEGSDAAGEEPATVLVDGLVRRLGASAVDVESSEELIALLVAEIDPAGEIRTVDDLRTAMTAWLQSTSAITLSLTGGTGDALAELGFDEAVALLDGFGLGEGVVGAPISGISGAEGFDIGGVTWRADAEAQTIVFAGSTLFGGAATDAIATVSWAGGSPTVEAAVRVGEWGFGDAGVDGPLGEQRFGPVTVVATAMPSAVGGPIGEFVRAAHPGGVELLDGRAGVSVVGDLPASMLPNAAHGLIGGDGNVAIGAWLGSDLGVITAGTAPEEIVVAAAVSVRDAPALPTWAQPTPGGDWRLVMTITDGATSFALDGSIDVTLGGATRAFRTTIDAAVGNGGSSAGLTAVLAEPWPGALGVDWLDLTTAELVVASDGSASLTGDGRALGRDVGASIGIDDAGQIDVNVSIDRLDIGEVFAFVADQTGLGTPDLGAPLVLDDVIVSARSGDAGSLSIGATTRVFGQQVDALVSALRVGSDSGVVIGLQVGAWSLSEAVPALADTIVADLEFPPTTFVLSGVEGTLAASDQTPAQARFFGGDVEVRSGLSIDSAVDVSGTALEAPLGALGFDGAVLPVTGTLPSGVLGGSGSSGSGGSPLDALALRIALPDIQPGGAPEWFRGGRLAVEISGSSAGLAGELDVVMDGEELTFAVDAGFVRQDLGYAMSLSGSLAGDRPWESPFGVSWLTLERVALELSVQPTGSVGVGFAGTAVIAGRDIDAAIAVEMTPAGVPSNFILSGASDAGLSTSDLLAVQRAMAGAAGAAPAAGGDRYPSLAIRNAELRFAPRGSEVLGVDQGFVLAGTAFVDVRGAEQSFGELDVRVSEDGLFALGRLAGYELGPLSWSDIDLDLALSPAEQRFSFDGSVELFGIDVEVVIDVSNDSVFFSDAIEEIRAFVELFETIVRDPAAAIDRIADLYRATGAPAPAWLDDLLDGVQAAVDAGATLNDAAIDAVLNGTRLGLGEAPAGGDAMICPADANFEEDGICYRTPSVAAIPGLPLGGEPRECPSWAPRERGGDCYSLVPDPCAPLEVICDPDGTPNGGTDKVCRVDTPIRDGGRCYTTPPIPPIPAQPESGVDRVCPTISPLEEDGRCYRITPSMASVGLDLPGLCTPFRISCSIEDLLRGEIARDLAESVADRLDDW